MNIHEYQAKQILRAFDMPVPRGGVAFSAGEAVAIAKRLGGSLWVVKAQIHAGGRGKAGGVQLARSLEEVQALATQMLGQHLVTHQTGPQGREVSRLYIEEGMDIAREFYLSAVVDRASSSIAFIASTEGGVDIEEVAAKQPQKITTLPIDAAIGACAYHGRHIAYALGLKGAQVQQTVALIEKLYQAFVAKDMSLLEINPLIVTKAGDLICLDAKMTFDSNALYRHPEIVELRDLGEEDPAEIEASKHDLNYIKLDGTIGCMVNGAGLAMATMDIIKLYGAEPANFLDVGGGADKEKVAEAFKIILSDKNVQGILINIFGGIMHCDIIAEGVVAAAKELSLRVPLVVRLEGTNVDEGKKLMAESDLAIIPADNLADAAEKITSAVRETV